VPREPIFSDKATIRIQLFICPSPGIQVTVLLEIFINSSAYLHPGYPTTIAELIKPVSVAVAVVPLFPAVTHELSLTTSSQLNDASFCCARVAHLKVVLGKL